MFRPSADPSALRALTDDPAVEHEFSAKWRAEEEALAAYEDVAFHEVAIGGPAQEPWEVERDHMDRERDANEETCDRYA